MLKQLMEQASRHAQKGIKHWWPRRFKTYLKIHLEELLRETNGQAFRHAQKECKLTLQLTNVKPINVSKPFGMRKEMQALVTQRASRNHCRRSKVEIHSFQILASLSACMLQLWYTLRTRKDKHPCKLAACWGLWTVVERQSSSPIWTRIVWSPLWIPPSCVSRLSWGRAPTRAPGISWASIGSLGPWPGRWWWWWWACWATIDISL